MDSLLVFFSKMFACLVKDNGCEEEGCFFYSVTSKSDEWHSCKCLWFTMLQTVRN